MSGASAGYNINVQSVVLMVNGYKKTDCCQSVFLSVNRLEQLLLLIQEKCYNPEWEYNVDETQPFVVTHCLHTAAA